MEKQGLHIDFKVAKQAFESYLDEYDREDDKIQLKIVHTYCVVDAAEEIATRMHLREEDVQLAKIIGLLHDIGRFEQIKRFHSFEPGTMDHAMYGADILFGPEQMIRRFVKDSSFDQLICVAIAKHSDFKLEGIEDKRTLLHARLIRDADKLDNCRVKLEASVEAMLGVSEKDAGEGLIWIWMKRQWAQAPYPQRCGSPARQKNLSSPQIEKPEWITGCRILLCTSTLISWRLIRS